MQIQWRRHEIFLAGIIACCYILSVWVRDSGVPPAMLEDIYGSSFKRSGMPFNYIRNVGGPETLMAIVLFTGHLLLNLLLTKRSLFQQNIVKLLPRLALIFLLLLGGAFIVQYFEEQYLYHGSNSYRHSLTYAFARGGKAIIHILVVYVPYPAARAHHSLPGAGTRSSLLPHLVHQSPYSRGDCLFCHFLLCHLF